MSLFSLILIISLILSIMQDIPESNGFMVFRNVLLSVIFFTSSLFYKMSARHERHEYDTSDVSPAWVQHEHNEWNVNVAHVLYERYEWAASATQTARVRHEWKVFILVTTRVKTYFHTPILAIWDMKDYKERNNFILRTTFWKCLISMPEHVWKVHNKNWTW